MRTPGTTDRTATAFVRPAAPEDAPALVDVLCAAFQDDPVFAWMIPDPARRAVLDRNLFGLVLEGFLPLGWTFAAESDPAAAAVWAPAGLEPDPEGEAALNAAFVQAAEEHGERVLTVLSLMADVHPHDDHAYLFLLGTRPARQSSGLGSALLRHVTGRLDAAGTPAYLEATSEANRRLYVRHGFADIGVIQIPDGPPMFQMWREPR